MKMSELENLSDDELSALVAEGNADAEEMLVVRYVSLVKFCARPYFLIGGDGEDLLQEGMLGLLSAVRNYNSEREAAFKTYAEICIRRRIYSAIRKFASVPPTSETTQEEFSTVQNPEELLIDREKSDEFLKGFLAGLSKLERKILSGYLDGKSYIEIAESVNRPTKSVDNAIQRVRRKLVQSKTKN